MIFGVSLGCIHKFFSGNRNEYITFLRENFGKDINALEIIIPVSELFCFKLSEENRNWLYSLNYVSLHLPKIEHRADWTEISLVINYIQCIKYIVCHIDEKENLNPEFKFIFKDKIIFENTENCDIKLFKEQKKICFDFAHHFKNPLVLSPYQEIKEIHISACINGVHHKPLMYETDQFFDIKGHSSLKKYPIIVEVNFESLEEMKAEINFLKEELCII